MRAVKAKEREAFAKHLAEADGGANCIMTSTSCGSTDITSIIGNRKAAFAAELAVTGKEQGQRVFLKSAKLMWVRVSAHPTLLAPYLLFYVNTYQSSIHVVVTNNYTYYSTSNSIYMNAHYVNGNLPPSTRF